LKFFSALIVAYDFIVKIESRISMFTDKSDLLYQIHSALEKKFSEQKDWRFDFSLIQKALKIGGDPDTKNYLQVLKGTELKKLEERIEKLETQNEQLTCIVHFLFQKISDLTDRFSPSSTNPEKNLPHKVPEPVSKEQKNCDCVGHCKPALTKREIDVFNLLSKGLCAKEIAKILFISETTVITHKRNLKEKFRARNTVELISNVLSASH